ncbi:AGAP012034-PA-like protein [Anopheles sinensis]|uniref:AGAP012034-PA-like protein n=1 Tax=Anopheles sinensis TaxID=74873 RepID=A0A084VIK3_ANOSI|nr:AGAP012034-PA-like protein [Anopheles sinensis]
MYFGLYDLREKDKCLKDNSCQKRKPSKLFIHEMYKPNSNMQIDDIAMIRFDQPLNFTDFIEPICLPLKVTYDKSFEQEKENGNVFNVLAFGWGEMGGGVLSNTRRVVMLNVTTHDKCENSASSKTMCTFGVKERQDVCQGDSGSALVWLYKKQMYVVGVATYGPPCGMDPDRPSIAMRISYYIEWIKKAIMSELVN